ncbi:MAG: hypothetical protein CL735_00130 [Chloroflexi bacterium]|nr:hypothetical protein [Chloroflexota bacterium]
MIHNPYPGINSNIITQKPKDYNNKDAILRILNYLDTKVRRLLHSINKVFMHKITLANLP